MDADWDLLAQHPELVDIVETESRRVARQYEGIVEAVDLMQEAFIAIATQSDKVQQYLDEAPHYLPRWVWERMTDAARRQLRQRGQTIPIERLLEAETA